MRAVNVWVLLAVVTGIAIGMGLAMPSPAAAQALERLEAALEANPVGSTEPGYLGLITDDRQDRGFGVRVMEVIMGGPAQAAGIQEEDLIVSANGVQVRSMDDLAAVVQKAPSGRQIAFELLRGRQIVKANVTLGKRPAPGERRFEQFGPIPAQPVQPSERPEPAEGRNHGGQPGPGRGAAGEQAEQRGAGAREPLGITVGPTTAEDRQRLRLGPAQGVLVVDVVPNSAAAEGGILSDDFILSIAGVAVTTADEIAEQLNRVAGDQLGVVVLRQGRTVELLVHWPGGRDAAAGMPQAPKADAVRPQAPGAQVPGAQVQGAEAPRPQPPRPIEQPDAQQARIQALEQRIGELEALVRELQQRLDQQQQ